MSYLKAILVSFSVLIALPAVAGPYADALGGCLADSTTGKERKELARWIFVAMATHPEMRDLSGATEKVRDQTSQSVGVMLTRLLSENCARQARSAIQNEGSEGMQAAFGSLGRLAMQELMSNRDVAASISAFERYVDRKKVESALAPK